MLETLYKTASPEELERAEYYQPHIEPKFHQGKWFFVVTEKHAWYDGTEKDAKLQVTTLDPEPTEGFTTIEEAKERYDQQVEQRVSEGLTHSFSIDWDGNAMRPVYKHELLVPASRA